MAVERAEEYTIEIAPESAGSNGDGFNTEHTTFSTYAKQLRVSNLAIVADNEVLEDDAFTTDLGENEPFDGLAHPASSASFDTWAEGLGTAAGDQVAAVANAVSYCVAGCLGEPIVLSTGSTVAVTTAIGEYEEVDGANHGAGELVCTDVGGLLEVRPCYAYSSPTISLAINHTAIPAAAQVIYGGANAKYSDNPSTFETQQIRSVGKDARLNNKLRGMVSSLSLSEQPPNQAQKLSFSWNIGSFAARDADVQLAPTRTRPTVLAGGSFMIALEGIKQNPMLLGYGSIGVNFNSSYKAEPNGNDTSGLQSWLRDKGGSFELTVHMRHDSDPSAASNAAGTGGLGLTEDNWQDVKINGGHRFQALLQYGRNAGGIWAIWMRSLYLKMWEKVSLDGIEAQKLTFSAKTGATYAAGTWAATTPRFVIAQF